MTFVFCCCCRFLKSENTLERQSLLHPATQASPTATGMEKRSGMTPKRVGVPEIDQAFADVAETFNQQQEHYKTMTECLTVLRGRCRCSHGDGLSVCMRNMRDEYSAYSPSLQMKGYDFSLVLPPGPVPKRLQEAQQQVRAICLAAKAITETSTKLQEMIDWVLHCRAEFAQRVGDAAQTYLDQRRVEANLRENMEEVQRARDLSQRYRQEAGDLMREVDQLSGRETEDELLEVSSRSYVWVSKDSGSQKHLNRRPPTEIVLSYWISADSTVLCYAVTLIGFDGGLLTVTFPKPIHGSIKLAPMVITERLSNYCGVSKHDVDGVKLRKNTVLR